MSSRLLVRGWPPEHPMAVRGEGRHVWTADGRRFLDGASGALAATLGYSVPEVAEAIADQSRRLAFAHSLSFTTEVAEAYAGELAKVLPGDLSRSYFVTGGSEAIEMALLLAHRIQVARGEPGRRVFLSRHLSYHGSSIATLGLGARVRMREDVAALLPTSPHVPPPYPYRPEWRRRFPGAVAGVPGLAEHLRTPLADAQVERGRADAAEAVAVAIEALGAENVCAFVAEPVIGASAGAIVPDDAYWRRVREICDRTGVLWIADEVMTGMGRTGEWLAAERWGVVPDIVALGKGLAGAFQPLGAVVVRERDWHTLSQGPPGVPYGFTFSQHPVAVAAGRAVLQLLKERSLLVRSRRMGGLLIDSLGAALAGHPHVGEIRGMGLMVGVELVADRAEHTPFPPADDVTRRVLSAAREAGVLLYPARGCADGVGGDAFLVAPALTVTEAEIEELVAGVVAGVRSLDDG